MSGKHASGPDMVVISKELMLQAALRTEKDELMAAVWHCHDPDCSNLICIRARAARAALAKTAP
jgi:hypothetical protein